MDGHTNDSFRLTPETSPEDTFNKLRRVPYEEACTEYMMACLYLHSTATSEQLREIADPVLEKLGWSIADLNVESRRREQAIQFVRK